MAAALVPALGYGAALRLFQALREQAVKDKTYRATPIGALAGRYLDTLEFDGFAISTLTNREQTLAWLALDHPDVDPRDVTYELLRAFLAFHWKDAAANTRAVHVSSLRNFFAWAYDGDLIPANPARRLRGPRIPDSERRAHSLDTIRKLIVAQESLRDRCALLLLYWCALRRNELRRIQFRHIDLANRALTVFGKGGKVAEQNIPDPVAVELERHILDRHAGPDEYLLYPQHIGRYGTWPLYRDDVIWEDRLRPFSLSGIGRWWERCTERAGLEHFPMHELRHTAGTHFFLASRDLVGTQHFMRHASSATTERNYIHLDRQRHIAAVQRGMVDPLSVARPGPTDHFE